MTGKIFYYASQTNKEHQSNFNSFSIYFQLMLIEIADCYHLQKTMLGLHLSYNNSKISSNSVFFMVNNPALFERGESELLMLMPKML